MYHLITYAAVIFFSFFFKKDVYELSLKSSGFEKKDLPAYRGIYIDNSFIIGNTAKENDLLKWCKRNNFNVLSIYGLHEVFKNYHTLQLAKFIKRAKTVYRIREVSAIFELDSFHVTEAIDSFNKNTSDTLQRFNYYNFEP
jgi:hypothetical protein